MEICASPDRWGIGQFLGESHDGTAASVLQEDFVLLHHVDVVLGEFARTYPVGMTPRGSLLT
jgi:hypothetical protein